MYSIKQDYNFNLGLDNKSEEKTQTQYINNVFNYVLTQFTSSLHTVWNNMNNNHILPIKILHDKDMLNVSKNKIKTYIDYAKKIRKSKINLPEWFILSNGSIIQKIIPSYEKKLDLTYLALIESVFPADYSNNTLFMWHMKDMMVRDGINVSSYQTYIIRRYFSDMTTLTYLRNNTTGPESLMRNTNDMVYYYESVKYSILNKQLKRLFLITPRQLLIMIEIMTRFKKQILTEIQLINETRYDELVKIFINIDKNELTNIINKLWPELDVIITYKSGPYKCLYNQIKKMIGSISVYSPIYQIPEATIGYNFYSNDSKDNNDYYVIDTRKGYYEFIPIDDEYIKTIQNKVINDKSELTACGVRNLKKNQLYEIVVSNVKTGLLRYATSEIVRFIGYYYDEKNNIDIVGLPKIEIISKDTELLRINNKVITPSEIEDILIEKLNMKDYCYVINEITQMTQIIHGMFVNNNKDNILKLYIELFDDNIDKTIKINKIIQDKLGLVTEIRIVKSGTFDKIYKSKYNDYVDPGSIMISRLIHDKDDLEILKNNIIHFYP